MRVAIVLMGILGLAASLIFYGFVTLSSASGLDFLGHVVFLSQGFPFLFYIGMGLGGWSKRRGQWIGLPLHLIWVPAIAMLGAGANFTIPACLTACTIIFWLFLRSLPSDPTKLRA